MHLFGVVRIASFLMVCACAVLAQEQAAENGPTPTRTMLKDAAAMRALMTTPETVALRAATRIADQAYRDAVSAIPEISEIDREMRQLRDRMVVLIRQRRELEKAHADDLAAHRTVREATRTTWFNAKKAATESRKGPNQ